jgi:hypothetical protein
MVALYACLDEGFVEFEVGALAQLAGVWMWMRNVYASVPLL